MNNTAVMGYGPGMIGSALYGGSTPVTSVWYRVGGTIQASFATINESTGISKFWFQVDETGDGSAVRTEDQGGVGFAMQDVVVFAASSCRVASDNYRVDIAVRYNIASPISGSLI